MNVGTLVLLAGKMGAGKSTRAQQLAHARSALLISEDAWLAALYPGQIATFDDYRRCAALLKPLLKAHVADILRAGVDVVMDFPANTVRQRAWFKEVIAEANAPHELIYLKVSDALCLEQIAQRRVEQPERAAFDTEAMFRHTSAFFQAPDPSEGFTIRVEARDA